MTLLQALSRSVTQADPSLLNSITVEVADEADEVVNATPRAVATRRLRQRAKSSSFSLGVHDRDVLQKSGLLHALQQHVRATHAFAPAPPASARAASREQVESVESAEEASVHIDEQEERLLASLRDAKSSNDPARVLKSVIEIRESGRPYTSSVYNAALDALHHTRRSGDSLKTILELYNDMVSRSVLPNGATYTILITALTDRDVEITAQISSVKKRAKRLVHLGKYVEDARKQDEARLRKLCREDNLPSALVLFQAGCLLRGHSFSRNIYSMLLRSCAAAGNVEAALRIFRHLETRLKPNTVAYRYLLQAHSRSGDLHGARGVFSAYSQATKAGRVQHEPDAVHPSGVPAWRVSHVEIWNEMIMSNFYHGEVSEALGVLHQMLAPDVSPEFQLDHTPPPSPSTYTGIIQAFIRSNDIDSALTWFHRLLQEPTLPGNPNISHPRPTKPTARAWKIVIEALAYDKKVEELNRIVEIAARDNLYELDSSDRFLLVHFNLKSLRDLPRDQLEVKRAALDQLVDTHVRLLNPYLVDSAGEMSELSFDVSGVHFALSKLYMTLGDYERVIGNLEWFVSSVLKDTLSAEQSGAIAPEMVILRKQSLRMLIVSTTSFFWFNDPAQTRPLHPSMRLAELSSQLDMLPRQPVAGHYIPSYLASSEQEKDLLSITHWELFVTAVCNTAYEVPEDRNYYAEHDPVGLQAKCLPATFDLYTVLVDMNKRGVDIRQFSREVKRRLGKALVRIYGRGEALKRIQGLDLASANELSDVIHAPDTRVRIASEQVGDLPVDLPDTAPSEVIRIDLQHSRFIDEFTGPDAGVTPVQAFARFQAGAQMGLYPRPEVIGRLISALGRAGEIEMLHELYKASQLVLAVLEYEKETQSLGWFQIEDQMIIGLAHAGQVDAAHVHRIRILEQGGCPSADAYGALIENVTDTTDDTTNALALFEEAGARGSHPNIYLYNTIISKLAKARKADHALELFQRMKLQHIRPTSVTYGALIAACCRVGDAISAETLFTEMTTQKNFKPRIPPYNTMMQLYTHTKPDRQRVLYYFKQMGKVGVNPTAHTYKVVLVILKRRHLADATPLALDGCVRYDRAARSACYGTHLRRAGKGR